MMMTMRMIMILLIIRIPMMMKLALTMLIWITMLMMRFAGPAGHKACGRLRYHLLPQVDARSLGIHVAEKSRRL